MGKILTISDNRTVFCKSRMTAHNGAWNRVTNEWMFASAGDHANALCELYTATRASITMRETLGDMILDRTAAAAWGIDPLTEAIDVDTLEFAHAQKLLAAGYAARRVLGIHPLENRADDRPGFDDEALRAAAFDERARAGTSRQRRRRSA